MSRNVWFELIVTALFQHSVGELIAAIRSLIANAMLKDGYKVRSLHV